MGVGKSACPMDLHSTFQHTCTFAYVHMHVWKSIATTMQETGHMLISACVCVSYLDDSQSVCVCMSVRVHVYVRYAQICGYFLFLMWDCVQVCVVLAVFSSSLSLSLSLSLSSPLCVCVCACVFSHPRPSIMRDRKSVV